MRSSYGPRIRACCDASLTRRDCIISCRKLERGDSKHLILGLVRYSPEGRRHAVPVRGLRWRFAFERACEVPVAGRFVRYLVDLARLPTLMREARQNETRLAGQLAAASKHVNAANRATYGMVAASSQEQRQAIDRLDQAIEQQGLATARMTSWKASAEQRLSAAAVANASAARATLTLETGLGDLTSRVTHIEEDTAGMRRAEEDFARAAAALETGLGSLASRVAHIEEDAAGKRRAEEDFAHAFDELYATFEEQFRGERDDVKGRVAVYVPRLVDAGLGTSEAPVLDLGCGRGEWLEVLKDHGLRARGVDTNRTMLAYCRALGLEVAEADALACLRETPAASLGVVTGFHIVEHLTSALPGVAAEGDGPNTASWRHSPSSKRPIPRTCWSAATRFTSTRRMSIRIPPATLRFFVEAAGLRDVEIVFLHPSPDHERLTAGDQAVETFVNSRFFGPRDYAVIARKA